MEVSSVDSWVIPSAPKAITAGHGFGASMGRGRPAAASALSLKGLSKPAGRLTQPGLGTQGAVNA